MWSKIETWTANGGETGRIPIAEDDVIINGATVIDCTIYAKSITIAGNNAVQLVVDPTLMGEYEKTNDSGEPLGLYFPYLRAEVGSWHYEAIYPDSRIIDLTGLDLTGSLKGGLSCIQNERGYLPTGEVICSMSAGNANSAIMADPMPLSRSASLEETSNISVTRQVSRWKSAGVRRGTLSVLWPKSGVKENGQTVSLEAMMDRMTRQPFRVFVYTPSWILCGHISSVTPRQSGGEGWQTVDITIVEG